MSRSIPNILKDCENRLAKVDSPRLSAQLLTAHALGCSRLTVTLERNRILSDCEIEAIHALVARREAGEPVAYILGEKEFYGLDFFVTPDVLIPRPETEHIVEEVERLYPKDRVFRFADLGTGSGILAVTLCVLFPGARGVAVDISPAALHVAQRNAHRHGVDDRIDFQCLDFTKEAPGGEFDLIVSNPPYVTAAEFNAASHEVTTFEPTGALVSGVDGMDHIRAMLPGIESTLKAKGHLLMEIGFSQGEDVKKIICREFSLFGQVAILKDLAGHDRVVVASKL
ncbi:peptide chain release factor N(5)-glutamine methyltransferase [Pseudodesulfovibrio sp. S3]|uniref:peptide chain release factor N(5)-glutamine methyltransferase n=1 Tax=unclassified Pseudodesulfovibrio TaxID=2661612 RepID=UPI000FEBB449|nr:peptide chain release factor N(5)-glutamine methyltransferase [Pseudodesulfovibrio sp. S3]RWU05326.1 peptide chain release factor N(5)-glutamine methyltransferase [Pseudodesulfovibrio sp. S3]